MANTSLTLGEHWEVYLKNQVASGRYGSASEVVRDALRRMEEQEKKLQVLSTHLTKNENKIAKGERIENLSMDSFIQGLNRKR